MRSDLQTRGFTLTPALRAAVNDGVRDYETCFPQLSARVSVRLFDVAGRRGGIDKGCLIQARVGRAGTVVVASELDSDLYRAIAATFDKLERGTATALARNQAGRHAPPRSVGEA